jgi:hypothetical protein
MRNNRGAFVSRLSRCDYTAVKDFTTRSIDDNEVFVGKQRALSDGLRTWDDFR